MIVIGGKVGMAKAYLCSHECRSSCMFRIARAMKSYVLGF